MKADPESYEIFKKYDEESTFIFQLITIIDQLLKRF